MQNQKNVPPMSHLHQCRHGNSGSEVQSMSRDPVLYQSLVPVQHLVIFACVLDYNWLLCCCTQAPAWSLCVGSAQQAGPYGFYGHMAMEKGQGKCRSGAREGEFCSPGILTKIFSKIPINISRFCGLAVGSTPLAKDLFPRLGWQASMATTSPVPLWLY